MRVLKFIFDKLKLLNLISYLRQNYASFAKFYLTLMLKKNHKQHTILVYTIGKVGSTSILRSLESQLEGCSIYHIHWLNKENLIAAQEFNKTHYHKYRSDGMKINILPSHIIRGMFVNKLLNNTWRKPNVCKVITLTRDPVDRQISAFFQNFEYYYRYNFKNLNEFDNEIITEKLFEIFLNEYITQYGNGVSFLDPNPLTWFDEELKKELGIDIYSRPFPKEKGFALYKKEGVEVLLIRLEDLNRVFGQASAQLLDKSLKILESNNVGDKKRYSEIYKIFKDKLILPDWYLDEIYTSKYATHFYSKSEIKHFRDKWTKSNISVN